MALSGIFIGQCFRQYESTKSKNDGVLQVTVTPPETAFVVRLSEWLESGRRPPLPGALGLIRLKRLWHTVFKPEVYTMSCSLEPVGPFPQSDGHDAAWLVDELVPGVTIMGAEQSWLLHTVNWLRTSTIARAISVL
jgi:hypothetical protein